MPENSAGLGPTRPTEPGVEGERGGPAIARPGALRGQAWLTLQTRYAGRLVKGRQGAADRPPITGLLGFANLLRAIWHGARADDPYADWWLVRVDRALSLAGANLDDAKTALEERLATAEGMDVDTAASVKPTRVKLQFANPYAYRGAQLLVFYDGFARRVLSAQYVGLLTRIDAEQRLHHAAKPIRRAFASALGYRFLGITRLDVAQGTAKAEQAVESMGAVPAEILSGAVRAELAPVRPESADDGMSAFPSTALQNAS